MEFATKNSLKRVCAVSPSTAQALREEYEDTVEKSSPHDGVCEKPPLHPHHFHVNDQSGNASKDTPHRKAHTPCMESPSPSRTSRRLAARRQEMHEEEDIVNVSYYEPDEDPEGVTVEEPLVSELPCPPGLGRSIPKPEIHHVWSSAKIRAWEAYATNPNAFYMKFSKPDEPTRDGPWSAKEHDEFMQALIFHAPNDNQWGLFSAYISGRNGAQCHRYYHYLLANNIIKDPEFLTDAGDYTAKRVRRSKEGLPYRYVQERFSSRLRAAVAVDRAKRRVTSPKKKLGLSISTQLAKQSLKRSPVKLSPKRRQTIIAKDKRNTEEGASEAAADQISVLEAPNTVSVEATAVNNATSATSRGGRPVRACRRSLFGSKVSIAKRQAVRGARNACGPRSLVATSLKKIHEKKTRPEAGGVRRARQSRTSHASAQSTPRSNVPTPSKESVSSVHSTPATVDQDKTPPTRAARTPPSANPMKSVSPPRALEVYSPTAERQKVSPGLSPPQRPSPEDDEIANMLLALSSSGSPQSVRSMPGTPLATSAPSPPAELVSRSCPIETSSTTTGSPPVLGSQPASPTPPTSATANETVQGTEFASSGSSADDAAPTGQKSPSSVSQALIDAKGDSVQPSGLDTTTSTCACPVTARNVASHVLPATNSTPTVPVALTSTQTNAVSSTGYIAASTSSTANPLLAAVYPTIFGTWAAKTATPVVASSPPQLRPSAVCSSNTAVSAIPQSSVGTVPGNLSRETMPLFDNRKTTAAGIPSASYPSTSFLQHNLSSIASPQLPTDQRLCTQLSSFPVQSPHGISYPSASSIQARALIASRSKLSAGPPVPTGYGVGLVPTAYATASKDLSAVHARSLPASGTQTHSPALWASSHVGTPALPSNVHPHALTDGVCSKSALSQPELAVGVSVGSKKRPMSSVRSSPAPAEEGSPKKPKVVQHQAFESVGSRKNTVAPATTASAAASATPAPAAVSAVAAVPISELKEKLARVAASATRVNVATQSSSSCEPALAPHSSQQPATYVPDAAGNAGSSAAAEVVACAPNLTTEKVHADIVETRPVEEADAAMREDGETQDTEGGEHHSRSGDVPHSPESGLAKDPCSPQSSTSTCSMEDADDPVTSHRTAVSGKRISICLPPRIPKKAGPRAAASLKPKRPPALVVDSSLNASTTGQHPGSTSRSDAAPLRTIPLIPSPTASPSTHLRSKTLFSPTESGAVKPWARGVGASAQVSRSMLSTAAHKQAAEREVSSALRLNRVDQRGATWLRAAYENPRVTALLRSLEGDLQHLTAMSGKCTCDAPDCSDARHRLLEGFIVERVRIANDLRSELEREAVRFSAFENRRCVDSAGAHTAVAVASTPVGSTDSTRLSSPPLEVSRCASVLSPTVPPTHSTASPTAASDATKLDASCSEVASKAKPPTALASTAVSGSPVVSAMKPPLSPRRSKSNTAPSAKPVRPKTAWMKLHECDKKAIENKGPRVDSTGVTAFDTACRALHVLAHGNPAKQTASPCAVHSDPGWCAAFSYKKPSRALQAEGSPTCSPGSASELTHRNCAAADLDPLLHKFEERKKEVKRSQLQRLQSFDRCLSWTKEVSGKDFI